MNIFYLSECPVESAQSQCDKHVVKMILEYAQLLSTAHRMIDGDEWTDRTASGSRIKRWSLPDDREQTLYKATHRNHPSAVWVRESRSNYKWLLELFKELIDEYRIRYGKEHKTSKLLPALSNAPDNLNDIGLTEVPQAMPDDCKRDIPLLGYRNYYKTNKINLFAYTKRNAPEWMGTL